MMFLLDDDSLAGNEELEAVELGDRVVGWCALADIYPDAIQDGRSPWYTLKR